MRKFKILLFCCLLLGCIRQSNSKEFIIYELINGCAAGDCCFIYKSKTATQCSDIEIKGVDGRVWVEGVDYTFIAINDAFTIRRIVATYPLRGDLWLEANGDLTYTPYGTLDSYNIINTNQYVDSTADTGTVFKFRMTDDKIFFESGDFFSVKPFYSGAVVYEDWDIAEVIGFGKTNKTKVNIQDIRTHGKAFKPFLVTVYPSPVTGKSFTVKFDNIIKEILPEYRFQLFDINGKEVKNIQFSTAELKVPVEDLKKGVYFYKVFVGKDQYANSSISIE